MIGIAFYPICPPQSSQWNHLNVSALYTGNYSEEQVKQILAEMKLQNFIPNVGNFGVGGPFSQGWSSLDNDDNTEVLFFEKASETRAAALSALLSKILSRTVPTKFLNSSSLPKEDNRHFVIDQSGLDMQIVLGR